MRNTNYRSHALCLYVQLGVAEQAADKSCDFGLLHSHKCKAISGMTELALVKSRIKRDESGASKRPQERNDFFILYPLSCNIITDLVNRHVPLEKAMPLVWRSIFIQKNHAAALSNTYSCA